MPKILEKVERRFGERLYIKGERCLGPKCALNRKPHPPGMHGNKKGKGRGKRGGSEFGEQLAEKQKVRYLYGLSEKEMSNYFSKALVIKTGTTAENFLNFIERRLDNAVFRSGFTISRSVSRHIVSHGHVLVNGRSVSAPSYLVRPGDVIEIKESRLGMPMFVDLASILQKYQPPVWIELDRDNKKAKIVAAPGASDTDANTNLKKVIEYYSR